MYFVNARQLRHDLNRGPLPSLDVALYLFFVLAFHVPLWYPVPGLLDIAVLERIETIVLIAATLSLAVKLVGLLGCYRANGGRAGSHLAERYVSLGWVVAVRISLVGLPFYAIAAYIGWPLTVYWPPIATVINAVFYVLLVQQFRLISAVPEHAV